MERTTLLRLFGALADEGVAYVLVGGVAVNLHGVVRATEDVHLFVRPSDDNVARLKAAFRSAFEVEPRDLDGVTVALATPRTLYRMKRDTTRPIDAQDAARLRTAFRLEEEA
jgi:hypothetical protein